MAQRELFPTDAVSSETPSSNQVAFQERVWAVARRIPRGRVTTYGAIAAALGDRRAARQVGWAMAACPADVSAIAHRVVNREGRLTGSFAFGSGDVMRQRLEDDGVAFIADDQLDLDAHFWVPVVEEDDELFGVPVTLLDEDEADAGDVDPDSK